MSWAEDFPHIPIWLRCTNRHLIDPNIRGSLYGGNKDWNDRRFTASQVREIRASKVSMEKTAEIWKVSYSSIYSIVKKESYKDVE